MKDASKKTTTPKLGLRPLEDTEVDAVSGGFLSLILAATSMVVYGTYKAGVYDSIDVNSLLKK
jgi:hypothetical protein